MLEEVLELFMRRFGLKEPDNSAGCTVIQSAMRGNTPVSEVRRVLTEEYEMYPQYEPRILEILDQLDPPVAAAEPARPAAEEAAATGPADRRRTRRTS